MASDSAEAASATPSTTSSRIFRGPARRQSGGARQRPPIQSGTDLRRSRLRKEAKLKIPRWEVCSDCKGSAPRARIGQTRAPVARAPGRCGSSKGSSASRVPVANARGRDESSRNPVLPARAVNAPIESGPSPYTSRPASSQACACASRTKESTESTQARQAIYMWRLPLSRTRSSNAKGTISSVTSDSFCHSRTRRKDRGPHAKGNTVIRSCRPQQDKTLRIKAWHSSLKGQSTATNYLSSD